MTELRQRYDRLLSALPIPEPRAPAPEPESAAVESPAAEVAMPATAASEVPSQPAHGVPAATLQAALLPEVAPSPAGAAPAPALSIYLTDEELIQRQPATHDGEVDP